MRTQNGYQILQNRVSLIRASERLTVAEAAEKYVRLSTGAWSNDLTHYMVEPAECLTKRTVEGVVFAGPARTGKTQMLCDNWAAYSAMCDPTDHMLVFPIDELAQVYSKTRIDKLHRYSPKIRDELGDGRSDDNIGMKIYRSGMHLSFVSPTKNTLAMKDLARVGLSDYDRYEDDIGGDGPAWVLGSKRTETFLSRGMTMAESSPSKPITDANWRLTKELPHEAPPTNGILGLYNEGDRRRLYSQCQHCFEYWMPVFGIDACFVPDKEDCPDIEERVANSGLICPHCSAINGHEQERVFKKSAKWLKEGQSIDSDGIIHGEGRQAKIASFWMHGWHAAFQKWESIIDGYLRGEARYERSGDELAIKGVVNVDMGGPYLEKSRQSNRTAQSLQEKAEVVDKHIVPAGVRYLLATVDCQKYSFVVQVQGFGVESESWIVDRFSISVSERTDDEGHALVIEPATYKEDWTVLRDRVIQREYPTADGRKMRIRQSGLDMHGVPGNTPNAYAFWKKMKVQGLGDRFRLLRGEHVKNYARVRETIPDKVNAQGKKIPGDVPVMHLNTDLLKDIISARLDRSKPGPGYIHFPSWLPDSFYEEIVAETRTEKGWEKDHDNVRNESLDLLVYALALNIDKSKPRGLNAEKINWDRPPSWADEWDKNSNVIDESAESAPKRAYKPTIRLSDDPYLSD